MPVTVNVDRFTPKQVIAKDRDDAGVYRGWILARTVDVEEPQACDRRSTRMCDYPSMQFAASLVRPIGTDWTNWHVLHNGKTASLTIDSRRRCKYDWNRRTIATLA